MNWIAAAAVLVSGITAPALGAQPQPSPTPVTTIEIGGSSEGLSNGYGSWASEYLTAARRYTPRKSVYFTLGNAYRFESRDVSYTGGAYVPVSPNTILNVELAFSPTHEQLPHDQVYVSLEHRLAAGWGYTLETQRRSYGYASVQTGAVLVDRYWGEYRAAYWVTGVQLSKAPGLSISQAASLTRYSGTDDESSMTLAINAGREADDLENGVHLSSIVGATLSGLQQFAPRWGFTWVVSTLREGFLYTRSGVQLGVRARL